MMYAYINCMVERTTSCIQSVHNIPKVPTLFGYGAATNEIITNWRLP